MSSVPAPRAERLLLPPRSSATSLDQAAAAPFRPPTPDLYPRLFGAIRAAFLSARSRRELGAWRTLAETGRETGARV